MPPRLRHPKVQAPSVYPPTPSHKCQCICQNSSRKFSSSPSNSTRQRADMFRWLAGPGDVFRQPLPGSTNYLSAYDREGHLLRAKEVTAKKSTVKNREQDEDEEEEAEEQERKEGPGQRELRKAKLNKETPGIPKEKTEDFIPFPMNRTFRSQPVLSEELKDAIWKRVMEEGKSVRDVSATLGVDMNRVGAVVRLKAVEKEWEKQGIPLANPYARAIRSMLPQTPYIPHDPVPHEPINDLPVHRLTTRQIFHPVSESRHFTRRDAGTVFSRDLLPADDRIPHPELVQMEKWRSEGVERDKRLAMQRERDEREKERRKEAEARRAEKEAREVTMRETERSVFRFRDVKVDLRVGRDGRGRQGVGARYGVPHEDRKKGQIKIPTRVG